MFYFANLFYMRSVSGKCRAALVLYRLCLAWLKRCAGAAVRSRPTRCKSPNTSIRIKNYVAGLMEGVDVRGFGAGVRCNSSASREHEPEPPAERGRQLMGWGNEHVAHTPYSANGIGVSWVRFYLSAQTSYP